MDRKTRYALQNKLKYAITLEADLITVPIMGVKAKRIFKRVWPIIKDLDLMGFDVSQMAINLMVRQAFRCPDKAIEVWAGGREMRF